MVATRRILPLLAALATTAVLAGCGGEPTLALEVVPPDANVSVDGYVHPGGSPHEIVFKSAGRYRLNVDRQGYKPLEMMITLGEGERLSQKVELIPVGADIAGPIEPLPPPDIPDLPPEPPVIATGGFKINITSSPSGATVTVREPGSGQPRPAGVTPVTVSLPTVGATEVIISKAGYREYRRLIVAPVGSDTVNLAASLERKRQPRDPQLPPPIAVDPPIADPGATGYLSVNTNPWSTVAVDGKPVGNTPLVNYRLSAGYHTVVMENRDLGKRRKKGINVRSGEHVRLMESL